ncbi:Glycosyltransferase involved in cell wall bisynthesis [Bacteroides luti]|uniref:Glycosyltransferase involved in cell wall bisynthesis n=1 Tax=Bacteroides luti TaxID=1297750 RepID=A0A1M4STK9_9BACE|nr:glycosyltransferase family 4 protein [Bacteroides luti]SHE35357.1 Glycosyltransferase involved in cell wall bisynthesis [Bacteroides luti]
MKILHLIFSLEIGGAESMMVDIANRQVVNNDVYVYIINSTYNKSLLNSLDKNIKIHLFNRKEGSKNLFKITEINYKILKLKPDITHCHNSDINKILFIHSFTRTLLTIHAIGLPLVRVFKFNKVVAISLAVKEHLLKNGLKDILVNYNGININTIQRKVKLENSNVYKIIQVSRLDHLIKGQDILLKALNLLNKEHKIENVHIDFIGEGDSLTYLKKIVSKYELEDKVTFLGIKDRSYIYSNIKNYDLLVQPSIIEGFGLTVAEGMAAKIPVLVSANDGPMEIIRNGEYGFYFKKGDAVDCANQIKNIIESNKEINRIVENAYQHCIDNFDINKTVDNYIKEYQNIIDINTKKNE